MLPHDDFNLVLVIAELVSGSAIGFLSSPRKGREMSIARAS